MKIILKYIKSWGIHYRWTLGLFWFIVISGLYTAIHGYGIRSVIEAILTVIIMDLIYGFDRTSPLFSSFTSLGHDEWEKECAWFAHNHTKEEKRDWWENTGDFVDGKPIQRHRERTDYICTKCGDRNYGYTHTLCY